MSKKEETIIIGKKMVTYLVGVLPKTNDDDFITIDATGKKEIHDGTLRKYYQNNYIEGVIKQIIYLTN